MMLAALIDPKETSPLVGLFGAFHPGIVHFPIALLTLAAALEVWQGVRRKGEMSPATLILAVVAGLSSVPACFFGFMLAKAGGTEGTTV